MSPQPHTAARSLEVDPSGETLLRDGMPIFLLADTLWAAFSRMSMAEWREALRLRRRQGFNAVNVSILPIAHDRSISRDDRSPFGLRADGSWDLDHLDDQYFRNARAMVQAAVAEDIIPILVVLWCNYVPNTWGAARTPEAVLEDQQSDRYVRLVLDSFADLNPIFCISGDDRFDDEIAVERYRRTLRQVRDGAPHCLTTLHSTPDASLPPELASDAALSYYSFQSGHDTGWQERPQQLAEHYRALPSTKPVVNMEPCYEGHAWGGGRGRHDSSSVRLASWTGVLAGAGAGLGYAAHGAWSWHRTGDDFTGAHFSGTPFPAPRALELPGAWDVGLLRRIVEEHRLFDLRNRDDLLADGSSGGRLGMSPRGDRAVLYLPSAFPVEVHADFARWRLETWDLSKGRRDDVRRQDGNAVTRFEQPHFLGDALYVLMSPDPREELR
nr:DUF4038 domain-containing protein [uncultured Friedmanniella sp.]